MFTSASVAHIFMDLSVQVSVTSPSCYLSGQILIVIFIRSPCTSPGLIYFIRDVLYSFAFECSLVHTFLGLDFVCVNYTVPATISSCYFLVLQDNIS